MAERRGQKKMKRSVLLVLLFLAAPAFAQLKPRPDVQTISKESMHLTSGTIHLGMTKAQVAEKLVGSDIRKDTDDSWTVEPNTTIVFSKGVLVYAQREWWIGSGSDIVQSIFHVASLFTQEGLKFCMLSTDTKNDISAISIQRVFIKCGKKSIMVSRWETVGEFFFDSVAESLGNIPDVSK
jgi:hypothetical protein